MRLGIFGGTLDPIHYGHLRTAEEIRESFNLDKIIFIPSAYPPHKAGIDVAPFNHRLTMARIATQDNPFFEVSDVECKRGGKSYSVDTLRYFKGQFQGELEIYFVLGTDAFLDIRTWKDYQELFSLSNFIVVSRPGFPFESLDKFLPQEVSSMFTFDQDKGGFLHSSGHFVFIKNCTSLDISATRIRLKRGAGESIRYFMPPAVENYIYGNRLYY